MAAAAELDEVARGLPDAEAAQLAAQHAELGGRLAALQAQVATAAAVADLQARLEDYDAQVAAGGVWSAVYLRDELLPHRNSGPAPCLAGTHYQYAHLLHHPQLQSVTSFAPNAASGSYSNAAWAARQVDREAAEALESGAPPDAAVAAQYAAFAERQASLLQVAGHAAWCMFATMRSCNRDR
jgi:hypothetical protein